MKFMLCNNGDDWHYLREQVFVKEQGFCNEFDELDMSAQHITGYVDGRLVCCARCYLDDDHVWHIGRVAVFKEDRAMGYGKQVIAYCEEIGKRKYAKIAQLDAQCRVIGFYEHLGYQVCGEEHFDEHVAHVQMNKLL